jgi:hypothetical protein
MEFPIHISSLLRPQEILALTGTSPTAETAATSGAREKILVLDRDGSLLPLLDSLES